MDQYERWLWRLNQLPPLHSGCPSKRVTKPLNHFFQPKTKPNKYLVMFLIDSGVNLDIFYEHVFIFLNKSFAI